MGELDLGGRDGIEIGFINEIPGPEGGVGIEFGDGGFRCGGIEARAGGGARGSEDLETGLVGGIEVGFGGGAGDDVETGLLEGGEIVDAPVGIDADGVIFEAGGLEQGQQADKGGEGEKAIGREWMAMDARLVTGC